MNGGKHIVWFSGEVKTPPFSTEARQETGVLLRRLQDGESIGPPSSRPLSSIGRRVHELRINDPETGKTWRLIHRIDGDAIVVLEVFAKKSQKTPKRVVEACKQRICRYDSISRE